LGCRAADNRIHEAGLRAITDMLSNNASLSRLFLSCTCGTSLHELATDVCLISNSPTPAVTAVAASPRLSCRCARRRVRGVFSRAAPQLHHSKHGLDTAAALPRLHRTQHARLSGTTSRVIERLCTSLRACVRGLPLSCVCVWITACVRVCV
jgi:hypothetical protein